MAVEIVVALAPPQQTATATSNTFSWRSINQLLVMTAVMTTGVFGNGAGVCSTATTANNFL